MSSSLNIHNYFAMKMGSMSWRLEMMIDRCTIQSLTLPKLTLLPVSISNMWGKQRGRAEKKSHWFICCGKKKKETQQID